MVMIDINSSEWLLFVGVLISAVATFITRATPFYLISSKNDSKFLIVIEKYMGLMIMVILVCYCLKDIRFDIYPYGFNEILSIAIAICTHLWFKNILFSMGISTLIYMILIRVV